MIYMEELVKYRCENRIAYITLNRPEKRNALSTELVDGLKQTIRKAEQDTNCKVIVLEAEGEAFCAGADLAYLQQLQNNTFEENLADSEHLKELFLMIYESPKVFIAKIQGHALAGGSGLASVCDFSFAVPEAKLGYTEVKIGFIPAMVLVFLIRKIGEGKAKELLLSGKVMGAEKAKSYGLITEVIEAAQLSSYVDDFATKLCNEASADSLRLTKQLIAEVQHLDIQEGLSAAARKNAEARATDDCKSGIAAFLNKEKLSW